MNLFITILLFFWLFFRNWKFSVFLNKTVHVSNWLPFSRKMAELFTASSIGILIIFENTQESNKIRLNINTTNCQS